MCFVYGSWEPLDTQKILPRGVGAFSPIGKAIPRIFPKSTFYIFFQYRLRPKIFAAQSRQIAEFWGAGPIQSSPAPHGNIERFHFRT